VPGLDDAQVRKVSTDFRRTHLLRAVYARERAAAFDLKDVAAARRAFGFKDVADTRRVNEERATG
jgi:hypothetical protein